LRKQNNFKENAKSRGRKSIKKNGKGSPQCDLSLYQVSLKFPKGFRRSCKDSIFQRHIIKVQGMLLLEKQLDRVPLIICTSTQCDLSLYQVSSKSPKGLRRSCKDKVFFKEKAKSRGCNSLKSY
jgi:hypothetical protein